MKIKEHIIITVAVSSMIYYVYNSFSAFIACLAGGILIDLDHLLDYYMHTGVNFRVKNFFKWCYECQCRTLILFLHSLELMFILWIIISVFNLGIFWIAFAAGISQHMILDILYNTRKFKFDMLFYSFLFRLSKGFKKEYIMQRFYCAE